MKVDVNVDQEDVKTQIVQSILDSSIGEEITKSIETILEDKGTMYSPTSVVKKAIQRSLKSFVEDIVIDELKDKEDEIREIVQEKLTDKSIEKMIDNIVKRI